MYRKAVLPKKHNKKRPEKSLIVNLQGLLSRLPDATKIKIEKMSVSDLAAICAALGIKVGLAFK